MQHWTCICPGGLCNWMCVRFCLILIDLLSLFYGRLSTKLSFAVFLVLFRYVTYTFAGMFMCVEIKRRRKNLYVVSMFVLMECKIKKSRSRPGCMCTMLAFCTVLIRK